VEGEPKRTGLGALGKEGEVFNEGGSALGWNQERQGEWRVGFLKDEGWGEAT
jgi:hypothetical protein